MALYELWTGKPFVRIVLHLQFVQRVFLLQINSTNESEGKQVIEQQRDFKGVWIPKEVWLDTRLTALEKIIFTEIDSLDMTERGCYASNKHLADFCQCSETKVSKSISKLIELGYLYVKSFDGRQRELKSRFTNNTVQPCKKDKAELEKVQESNTINKTGIKPEDIIYIIQYLNQKADTAYRPKGKDNQKHIIARMNEGFKVEDFIAVIDKQCEKWKGTEYEDYLRPSTLFGTKFENYLNGKSRKNKPNTAKQQEEQNKWCFDPNEGHELDDLF